MSACPLCLVVGGNHTSRCPRYKPIRCELCRSRDIMAHAPTCVRHPDRQHANDLQNAQNAHTEHRGKAIMYLVGVVLVLLAGFAIPPIYGTSGAGYPLAAVSVLAAVAALTMVLVESVRARSARLRLTELQGRAPSQGRT
jgi:hypothetical protein